MTKAKISLADFAKSPTSKIHAVKSQMVTCALDEQADALPYSRVFTGFEFEDFLTKPTPKRYELLRLASKGRHSISDRAMASKRNPSAVSHEVSGLSALGLVKVEFVNSEGHGKKGRDAGGLRDFDRCRDSCGVMICHHFQ